MGTPIGFGLTKPVDGDSSTEWDDMIEELFDWAVTHTHNGVNSPISITPVSKPSQIILSSAWTALGDSRFSTILTMPSGRDTSNTAMKFISTADGNELNPTINGNVSPSIITVIVNEAVELKVIFI